jgi:hypothetical protein
VRLEEPNPAVTFKPQVDRRLRVPEPLPVKLVAVNDMRIEAAAGLERQLDAFYAKLVGMQRLAGEAIVYRTENFDLYVDVLEPPIAREDYRPVRAEVKSLAETSAKLREAEVPHVRRKGLVPGEEALVLQDPAGNWVELTEARLIG